MTIQRYYRKIIKIKAEASPNVRYALWEISQGMRPSGTIVVPGVLQYAEYLHRRRMWDKVRQSIGLDAEFWEGVDALLFPPDWLNRAEHVNREHRTKLRKREAKAIGIDPGQGVAESVMVAVDEYGILELVAKRTPDTSVIRNDLMAFARKWSVSFSNCLFDLGGGGQQIMDAMREDGYPVRGVGFGEAVTPELKRGIATLDQRVDAKDERYAYLNRRAQMYGELRNLLDPGLNEEGFGIPAEYTELRRQLAPLPLMYDKEGRMYLPPKSKRPGQTGVSIEDILGCSPDHADALVLAVHALLHKSRRNVAGAAEDYTSRSPTPQDEYERDPRNQPVTVLDSEARVWEG